MLTSKEASFIILVYFLGIAIAEEEVNLSTKIVQIFQDIKHSINGKSSLPSDSTEQNSANIKGEILPISEKSSLSSDISAQNAENIEDENLPINGKSSLLSNTVLSDKSLTISFLPPPSPPPAPVRLIQPTDMPVFYSHPPPYPSHPTLYYPLPQSYYSPFHPPPYNSGSCNCQTPPGPPGTAAPIGPAGTAGTPGAELQSVVITESGGPAISSATNTQMIMNNASSIATFG